MSRASALECGARALGWLGAISVLLYAFALLSVVRPWGGALGAYFAPRAILLLYVPFFCNALAFYARVRLGSWLLSLGEPERAARWARPRIDPHPILRSRREALVHRLALGRALLMQRDARGALDALQSASHLPRRAPELVALARWKLEAGERLAQLPELDPGAPHPKRASAALRAAHSACLAERCARRGRFVEARENLERAFWADRTAPRARLARARLAWFEEKPADPQDWLADWSRSNQQVPGREVELLIARVESERLQGDAQAARAYRERAARLIEEGAADERSIAVWRECAAIK